MGFSLTWGRPYYEQIQLRVGALVGWRKILWFLQFSDLSILLDSRMYRSCPPLPRRKWVITRAFATQLRTLLLVHWPPGLKSSLDDRGLKWHLSEGATPLPLVRGDRVKCCATLLKMESQFPVHIARAAVAFVPVRFFLIILISRPVWYTLQKW